MQKQHMHDHQHERGQSIIEVLIATLVVTMVLTAVAATLSVSVKNSAQAKYQEIARTWAQSGLEVFRRERNILGWQTFRNALNTSTYCLNTLPGNSAAFTTMSASACPSGVAVSGNEFRRDAVVTVTGPDEVEVDVVVSWIDGSVERDVTLTQVFRRYEDE